MIDLKTAKEMTEALTSDNEHSILSLGSSAEEGCIVLYENLIAAESELLAKLNEHRETEAVQWLPMFQAAVSGLWYENPMACGQVSAVLIGDNLYRLPQYETSNKAEVHTEKLITLARNTMWLAYVWNDHNFDQPAHRYAKQTCEAVGLFSVDDVNNFIASLPLPPLKDGE